MPFQDSNPKVIYDNILSCKIAWQGNFDGPTKDLIKRILIADPNLRPTIEEIK